MTEMADSSPMAAMMVTTVGNVSKCASQAGTRDGVRLTDIDTGILVLSDLVTKLSLGDLDVVLLGSIGLDEVEELVINVRELVLSAGDVGDVHVVGGRTELLQLLAGEDIDGDQVDLGVSVLAGLGGAHLDNLAGTTLNADMSRKKISV